jgi:hypothetical protein
MQPLLELKTRPKFCPAKCSLSMSDDTIFVAACAQCHQCNIDLVSYVARLTKAEVGLLNILVWLK